MDKAYENLKFFATLIQDPYGLERIHVNFNFTYPQKNTDFSAGEYDDKNDTVVFTKYDNNNHEVKRLVTFEEYINERILSEIENVNKQIFKGINEKRLIEEAVSYLEFNFIAIDELISDCSKNDKLSKFATNIVVTLKGLANFYLLKYRHKFTSRDFKYYSNCFDNKEGLMTPRKVKNPSKDNVESFYQSDSNSYDKVEYLKIINMLYDFLMSDKYKFLSKKTKAYEFARVFGIGNIELKRILWIGSNGSLKILIKELHNNDIIDYKNGKWETTITCFEGHDILNESSLKGAKLANDIPTMEYILSSLIKYVDNINK